MFLPRCTVAVFDQRAILGAGPAGRDDRDAFGGCTLDQGRRESVAGNRDKTKRRADFSKSLIEIGGGVPGLVQRKSDSCTGPFGECA